MKKYLILFFFFASANCLIAQDIILKKNGEEIYGSIKEISALEIKYNDTLTVGVLRVINKSEVFMIKFRNGTKEVYGVENTVEVKKEVPVNSPTAILAEGPIVDIGSNDYTINGRLYHFSQIKRMLIGLDDPQINRLLVLAKLEGVFGNILAYSSIPMGLIGLSLTSNGVGYGDTALTIAGVSFSALCIASNGTNIFFKIDKRKKIQEAIALYNKKIAIPVGQ